VFVGCSSARPPGWCTSSERWRRSSNNGWGPYLVGYKGLLQPARRRHQADVQGGAAPRAADPILFALAPIISATAAFSAFAVVPFGAETTFFGLLDEPLRLQVSDVNVAVLVIFAIASMGVYGIVLAGWSSNNKYSMMGGLRASAQMISYELSYGLALPACSSSATRCR